MVVLLLFVLKCQKSANKAEIKKYLEREYEAKLEVIEAKYQKQLQAKEEIIQVKNEELIQAYREKGTDLLEMAIIMSNLQQNIYISNNPHMSTGDTYNQNGKIGIGHNEGNIYDDSEVAEISNEATQQDSTQNTVNIKEWLHKNFKQPPLED